MCGKRSLPGNALLCATGDFDGQRKSTGFRRRYIRRDTYVTKFTREESGINGRDGG